MHDAAQLWEDKRSTKWGPSAYDGVQHYYNQHNKKLSYCWETVRRESMPRIAEIDVEMTT